jgi:predicted amidohydrolase YtcJ
MNYIYTNGVYLNSFKKNYETGSILTQNGIISHIGDKQSCQAASKTHVEIIDLKGKLLLPAFVDCHTHFVELSKAKVLVNLNECGTLEQIHSYLCDYRDHPPVLSEWVLGGGWDRNRLKNPIELNRHFLDAIFPNKPVALMSKDYHSKLCNSMALKLAGISAKTCDPYGGKIERDSSGEPTGVLYETAGEMMDSFIVPISDSQIISAIKATVREIWQYGMSGFHSMEGKHSRDLLLQASMDIAFRFCWHFQANELDAAASEGLGSYMGEGKYQIGGIKIFGDGSLGSQTAAMFTPYSSSNANTGILRYTDEELYALMHEAAEKGFSSTIHAIGNRCVRQVLDSVIRLNKAMPYADLMHRIEHVQSIRNGDLSLLKQSGMFASVQPLHLANDVPMIEAYWQDIQDQVYSFGSMLKADIPLGFGSDAPIESINPFLGIYSAIERRPALNSSLSPFRPEEAIAIIDAILAYTLGAAKSSRIQHLRGSIEIGKQADLMVIDDYRNLPNDFWLQARSSLTMINGEIVHHDH